MHECYGEPRNHGSEVEPAVESVLDLGEVAMAVLPKSEGVMGSGECRLEVAEQGIKPLEGLDLAAGLALPAEDGAVGEAETAQHLKTEQAIRGDGCSGRQSFRGPRSEHFERESLHRVEADPLHAPLTHSDWFSPSFLRRSLT